MVLFNHGVKHSSFGGGTRRRMFTINMQERHAEEDLPALREEIGNLSNYWAERAYGETMISTAGPGRMRHLEQRLENDGLLAELSRRAREEMGEPSRGGGQFDKARRMSRRPRAPDRSSAPPGEGERRPVGVAAHRERNLRARAGREADGEAAVLHL